MEQNEDLLEIARAVNRLAKAIEAGVDVMDTTRITLRDAIRYHGSIIAAATFLNGEQCGEHPGHTIGVLSDELR